MKDIHAGRTLDPAALSTPRARPRQEDMADLRPFSDWIKKHVALAGRQS